MFAVFSDFSFRAPVHFLVLSVYLFHVTIFHHTPLLRNPGTTASRAICPAVWHLQLMAYFAQCGSMIEGRWQISQGGRCLNPINLSMIKTVLTNQTAGVRPIQKQGHVLTSPPHPFFLRLYTQIEPRKQNFGFTLLGILFVLRILKEKKPLFFVVGFSFVCLFVFFFQFYFRLRNMPQLPQLV